VKKSPPSKLARTLASVEVPRGRVALAWLGQAGFVLKSPGGTLLALDPYLSNSCAEIGKSIGVDMDRQVPPPLVPGDLLKCDALLFTHSHQDHVDPETIAPYLKAGGAGPFIAPHEASDKLHALGVEDVRLVWPNHSLEIGDFVVKATFAVPLGGDDLTHVGYLIEVRNGVRFYFTGDTDYNEVLSLSVAPYQPDVMITVINPAFRNLSPADAAKLAKAIGPAKVIPCHYDLFPDNSLPPRMLRTNLVMQGMADAYHPLRHGEIEVFSGRRKKLKLA